ncbi:MAG: DUF5711 family protein [Tissierellaceae bacterium]
MEKRKSSKGLKILLLILLALMAFLLGRTDKLGTLSIFEYFTEKEKSLIVRDSIEDGDILDIGLYVGNLVKWKYNKLSFLKLDGTMIVEKEFKFSKPDIHFGDMFIYLYDKSSGDIYIFDKKGETINRLQLGREIYNLKESGGNLFYHIKMEGFEIVNVLDRDGVLVGNYSYEKENILTYSSNEDGRINALGLLSLGEENLGSKIDSFGQANERLGSLFLEGEIVLHLDFSPKDELIILTDRNLYLVRDGNIMWKKQFDLVKDIDIRGDRIYILYSNYLEVMDYGGRVESKIGFGDEYKKIDLLGDRIMLYGDNQLIVLDKDKQILKHKGQIRKAYQGKNEILLLLTEGIRTYDIVNKRE